MCIPREDEKFGEKLNVKFLKGCYYELWSEGIKEMNGNENLYSEIDMKLLKRHTNIAEERANRLQLRSYS